MTRWSYPKCTTNAVILTTAFVFYGLLAGAQPIASFSASPTAGCTPLAVNFQDNSVGADAWQWDFGNGNTSTLQNPATAYLAAGNYTVTLIAINTLTGQRDTFSAVNYINVIASPVSDFSASPQSGCANDNTISFTNLSTGAVSYTWDFGDGNVSGLTHPTHTYTTPGTYTIRLIAVNGFNCSSIEAKPNLITIHDTPAATFSSPFSSSCDSADLFTFNGGPAGMSSWSWDFGDGNTASGQQATHVYNSTGNFTVSLVVTDINGCRDTLSRPGYINIGNSLTPGFNASSTTGCDSMTVTFDPLVQNAISWNWDFGDGNASTLQQPSHTYTAPGSYTVTLAVNTSNGCNGTASYPNAIVIEPSPQASFQVSRPDPCDWTTYQFTNTSAFAVSYLWEFGDGTTSTADNPVHTYTGGGTQVVILHAYSANGCEDTVHIVTPIDSKQPKANFTGTPRSGCAPLAVQFDPKPFPNANAWFWDFGDGNTSTQQNPLHVYIAVGEYKVTMKLTNTDGCQDSIYKNKYIKVYDGQVTYTVPDTIVGCTPMPVSFANPLAGADSVVWHFGNGDSSTSVNASYVYTLPGIYTVNYFGSMPGGCSQYINPFAIIQVFEFLPDSTLAVSVTNCKPFVFQFTNPTPDIIAWVWDFGDGNTDTVPSPSHSYAQAGTYFVSVTLTNIYGCVKTVSTTVTTGHGNPINMSAPGGCTSDTITFSVSNPGLFTAYTWNFGDGSPTESTPQVSHTYQNTGAYIASLIAMDTAGCVDTFYTDTIHITAVIADFTTNDTTTGCNKLLVNFTDNSTGATTWFWDFGDGDTATSSNPSHYYQAPGIYSVTLTVTNGACVHTITRPAFVTVHEPMADFSFTTSGPCFPVTITCTDSSINPVSWLWDFGDGNTSTIQHPVHTFTYPPTGMISLTITDVNGCTDTKKRSNLLGGTIVASASNSAGCDPLTVNFSDSTTNAVSWQWDFGDGNTSTQQNPSNTYTNTGLYVVQLTVTENSGCTHVITLPDTIQVTTPAVDFISSLSASCAPAVVQFNSMTPTAVAWQWDFGDGFTSTSSDPSHIYSLPGYYTVTLTVWDSTGCDGTEAKIDYIHVTGTYAYFTLTSQPSCQNTFVQFMDSSINASTWQWNFGDGYTSNLQNPTHNYVDTGSYIVSLITTDSLGCISFYTHPDPIVVHPAPVAAGTAITALDGCAPWTVTFADSSLGATSVIWLFGNGDTSNLASPAYTYTAWGTYNVSVVAQNAFGCSDTFALPEPVNVLQTPQAQFSSPAPSGCSGSPFTLTNGSTGLSGPSFIWDIGGIASADTNPVVTLTQPGLHNVTLVVINANGCRDTLTRPLYLEVYDTLPPAVTPLLSVSVTSNSSVEVRWMPSAALDLKEYRLFRLNPNTSQYELIYSLPDTNNTNPTLDLVYTDTLLNTLYNTYTYKVQSADICDFAFPLSQSVAHTTINVSAQATGTDIQVQWTPYAGCPVQDYEIRRVNWQSGQSQFLGTVPGNITAYTDQTNGCPFTYWYRITATSLCGLNYISLSDTAAARPANALAGQQSDIVRSTVINNRSVLTEWTPPSVAPGRVMSFRIFRSVNPQTGFSHIATVPGGMTSYIDDQVVTDQQEYYYRIQIVNDCPSPTLPGYQGSSIHLQSEWTDNKTFLYWTPYDGWPTDVEEYIIEKKDANGQWVKVKVVPGTSVATDLDE